MNTCKFQNECPTILYSMFITSLQITITYHQKCLRCKNEDSILDKGPVNAKFSTNNTPISHKHSKRKDETLKKRTSRDQIIFTTRTQFGMYFIFVFKGGPRGSIYKFWESLWCLGSLRLLLGIFLSFLKLFWLETWAPFCESWNVSQFWLKQGFPNSVPQHNVSKKWLQLWNFHVLVSYPFQ